MKRVLGILLLSVAMLFPAIPTEAAKTDTTVKTEEEYVGKVVTMERQEGEVAVQNSAGRELKLRESGKMYNGYKVYTEDGYMWIALDRNGVLKMDLDTKVKIEKTGKNLEVVLEEGEVFFNISEQFKEEESFTIRTSTMTTGIRGTAGIVSTKTREDETTEFSIKLLEGHVDLEYITDEASNTHRASELTAGRTFYLKKAPEGAEKEMDSILSDLTVDEINGFAAEEIKDSKELQERMVDGSDIIDQNMVDEIIEETDEKLAEDEAKRDEVQSEVKSLTDSEASKLDKLANPFVEVEKVTTTTESTTTTGTDLIPLPDTSSSADSSDNSSGGTTEDNTSTEDTVISITITYTYADGDANKVFATQSGTSDTAPMRPILQPTASGDWYYTDGTAYDFETPLTGDTTFIWEAIN